jgi:Sulfotransferase family
MPIFRKDGKNILFIHIPKTGGSTIEQVFKDSGYREDFRDGKMGAGTINHLRRSTPQHMHGSVLRQTFQLGRFDLIFMIVREPLARFRSEYLWRNRHTEVSLDPTAIERWGYAAFDDYARNPYIHDNHLRPQIEFHVPGALVYYFEDGLDEVVRRLNADHGLGVNPVVPRVRTAEGTTGASSGDVTITPRLERRIREFYYEDFHTFGYAKAPGGAVAAGSPPGRGGTPLARPGPGQPRIKLALRRARKKTRASASRLARRVRRLFRRSRAR